MKDIYISDLRTNQDIVSYFIVKKSAVKTGSNKKAYLDLLLADSTGEISAKKWDIADEELPGLEKIKEGIVIKVKALVTEWNGMKQLRVTRIRHTSAEDNIDMKDYIKAAPEDPEEMYAYIFARAEAFEDDDLKRICLKELTDNREKLMYYPAAQKNHHAEMAGLLYHVKRMLMMAERACQVYTNLDRELVMAGVILHDMEKLNEIESNNMGISTGYSFEGKLLGHLVQGVKKIDSLSKELGIPEEKAVMLEHMILSHHYEPEFGSPKRPLFPEAEMLHYLDVLDAKMFDMQEALDKTEPGEFSDKVWTLDNRTLYRRKEESRS
ncbi:MAG TPA: HD domain-containing protein [Candidatus Copromorpha excrementigallinarum]|uniref:HD domain-containing protein n=1 Tax=Candidatus Allocopromorpha excrementigallinarum TaxID=2840742 RepID=A0A9D1I0Y3_9FIRM|nr:HD domain-containing protein [Candidatus Copromorpha excrementigallinarum]